MLCHHPVIKQILALTTISILLIAALALPTASSGWPEPLASASPAPTPATEADKARLAEEFGHLPLYFIENRGQIDSRVAYYLQGSDKTIYETRDSAASKRCCSHVLSTGAWRYFPIRTILIC